MPLSPGMRLGPFEVVAPIGAGGMGEVYRARDARLKRDVALKVLPDHLTADPDRLARFQREAEVLAALNHPHIAHIHGVEDAGGVRALVLELVEGPTLADRVAAGALPLDEALAIARQIADALEAAHDAGIVHRDLKPANIKVRDDGTVKVLDFGLARNVAGPASTTGADALNSPTITSPAMTLQGMILGTAAYMSPEQAKGRPADRRSDLWAFGCVLYEMLTGVRAFAGDDVSETLASVLKEQPDWSRVPADTPLAVGRLLRRCLQKDRRRRLADAGTARLELDEADGPAAERLTTPPRVVTRERLAWAALAAVLAAAALTLWLRPSPAAPPMRVELVTPPSADPSIAMSPDGRRVAFIATDRGRSRLWVRALDAAAPQPLPGTEGGRLPFFSSDGQAVGFFSESQLKRVDLLDGTVRVLANVINPGGATWHGDTILFARNSNAGPILRIPPAGGEPVQVTETAAGGEPSHRHPYFLPDGRRFLYAGTGTGPQDRIYVGNLDGAARVHLLDADGAAVYSGTGHLLFVRETTLFAQAFDPDRLTLHGQPIPIDPNVTIGTSAGTVPTRPPVAASLNGVIAFRSGPSSFRRQLAWFDRSGTLVARAGEPDSGVMSNPSLSPDGRRVALTRTMGGNVDLWIMDLARGILARFTSAPRIEALALWSPDSRRIAYTATAERGSDIYVRPADGSGREETVWSSPDFKRLCDWSPDGRLILYKRLDEATGTHDLWAAAVGADRKPFAVTTNPGDERDGQFSPDGNWIAYDSDESGRREVYLQRFPGLGSREQISTAGGTQVRWRADGRELYYVDFENALMAVPVRWPTRGGAPEIGTPQRLFTTTMVSTGLAVARQQYAASRDGQRFLINTVEQTDDAPLTLLVNWKPGSLIPVP